MAVRIHVTALRGCPAAEARAVFGEILGDGFGAVSVEERNGWTWFTTSVWGVGANDLNKGLCRLARPGVQFTTSDGDRWFLTIHGGPDGRAVFVHEFSYVSRAAEPDGDEERAAEAARDEDSEIDPDLAFLEDEPEAPVRPRTAFDPVADDLAEMGAPLPEALLEEFRAVPFSEAINRFRLWQAERIPQALADAGIPLDAAEARRVLLWENVTERERDGDLGNLPRLLSVLGLGGQWDDFVQRSEDPRLQDSEIEVNDDDDETCERHQEPPPPDHAQEVLVRVGGLRLTAIQGEPVAVPLKRLARLGFLSAACSGDSSPTMSIDMILPSGVTAPSLEAPLEPSDVSDLQVKRTRDGYRIAVGERDFYTKRAMKAAIGKPLTAFLFDPPDGTTIEVNLAAADEPATYQRYQGTARAGSLWIERSHPMLKSETLADALEIASRESREKIRARDEAEAEALEQAARRSPQLHNMGVRRKNRVVRADFDTGNLAKLLLRIRHRGAWDFTAAEASEAKDLAEYLEQWRQMRRQGALAARQRAAPHEPEILLKGRHSIYWRSDFLQLDKLDPEPRQQFDDAMRVLGFHHVGDLVAKKQRDIVVRVYVSEDRLSYGIQMGKRTMYLGREFVSRLSDGSGLTTTTNSMVESHPKAGIYYRHFPNLEPAALHEKHLEGLERFRARKNLEPVPLGDRLADVAREIELAFDRLERAPAD